MGYYVVIAVRELEDVALLSEEGVEPAVLEPEVVVGLGDDEVSGDDPVDPARLLAPREALRRGR